MSLNDSQFWPPQLRRFIDPMNERQIVISVRRLGEFGRRAVGAGIILLVCGVAALLGVGGTSGALRFGGGGLFAAFGLLGTRWALARRRRWYSLELRTEVWHIKSGIGRNVDRAIDISIKNASSRIVADVDFGDLGSEHLIVEDLTVRYDEPLPLVELGEGFCLEREQLEAIRTVIAESARLRAHETTSVVARAGDDNQGSNQ